MLDVFSVTIGPLAPITSYRLFIQVLFTSVHSIHCFGVGSVERTKSCSDLSSPGC